ncbi:hypothetical protein Pint_04330 [Pistacia integerrima]|uniref:Uncharacterized protein n=1 Tax=Pistacia integerrima TaxID=434235 RepID=A0ACC0Z2T1_9ROSI|nr:hypothetical protein Pint_04330 [Pistacia integerrima]
MAFSRTPLISFLLISLLFASSMAQAPTPAPAPTSLPPSASKTRPVAAPSPSRLHRGLLPSLVVTSPPSPLPSISSPAPATSPSSIAFPPSQAPAPAENAAIFNIFAEQITHALNRPIRKGLPRLETRHSVEIYSKDINPQIKTLLKFAKLDFNMLQLQHQKEVSSIARWWKGLDVETNLPYDRDRVVELYFWIVGVYFEPQYSLARRIMTKVISMTSILDDTYDAYGTYEELERFTDAIKRWDMSTVDVLPEYMKLIYQALLDVYSEAEEEISKERRSFSPEAYLVEAKWCNQGYVPTLEEYLQISLVTTPFKMLATVSFLGMGQIVNKSAFDWIANDPKIFEQKREHVASAVECYMKQHGVTEEEVRKLFRKEISNAWKDINQEFLKPTAVPVPLLGRILNLSRSMDVIYKEEDTYTNSYKLKDDVASVLVNPVPL